MKARLAGASRGFRPRGKTAERLTFADKLGLSTSEVINEILEKHLADYLTEKIEQRKRTLRDLLSTPVP